MSLRGSYSQAPGQFTCSPVSVCNLCQDGNRPSDTLQTRSGPTSYLQSSLGNNTEDKVLRSQAVLVGCTDITGQPYPNCASIGRRVVLLEPLSPAALLIYSVSSCSCQMPLNNFINSICICLTPYSSFPCW